MKSLFPEYSAPSTQTYKEAWSNGLFVFDTSVLLNLYRYRTETRDELLKVIGTLKDRIWIPFHVALEFQRNRLTVIASQNNLFSKVRSVVESSRDNLETKLNELQIKQRHALIDPEPLISGFSKLAKDFLESQDKLHEQQQKTDNADSLRDRIEALFSGRVGAPPKDQKELDEIYKRAEIRYKAQIPPGYEDNDKDKHGPDEHVHSGIIYKRKYGDFLIWDQILGHTKSAGIKQVIFITDDRKEDWWLKVDSGGPKTVGPRPELVQEARFIASVETFLMYSPEGFLKYSNEYLKAKVSEEVLKEVRDVSIFRSAGNPAEHNPRLRPSVAQRAVAQWLMSQYGNVNRTLGFPDIVVRENGEHYGFEVKTVRFPTNAGDRLAQVFNQYRKSRIQHDFAKLTFVLVTENKSKAEMIKRHLAKEPREVVEGDFRILIGVLNTSVEGEDSFDPIYEFPY